MVGLASGIVLGNLGFTHCCIEDISVMRSIPGMTVLSPADCGEVAKCVFAAARIPGPVYIRLTGSSNNPVVFNEDYDFTIGKAIELSKGEDITIFATGSMVFKSIEAAKILNDNNISSTVININTIKPIDEKFINKNSKGKKLIVTVEEHSIIGGLSSAVAEVNSSIKDTPEQLSISLPDNYFKGGDYNDLLNKYNLTPMGIANLVKDKLKNS